MEKNLLNIHNISFHYEREPLFSDVSFSVKRGDFIAIFGPNGGGKSTLLKLILGFLEPQKGSITLLGKKPKEKRTSIGYVPQSARFDKEFPISSLEVILQGALSCLSFWGRFPDRVYRKARTLMEALHISSLEKSLFGSLSGGEAQRVLLARALMNEPKLLLLDEPTASVDVLAEKAIHSVLETFAKEAAILMVTHNLSSILPKATKLLCVHNGIEEIPKQKLCDHYTLGLYHNV